MLTRRELLKWGGMAAAGAGLGVIPDATAPAAANAHCIRTEGKRGFIAVVVGARLSHQPERRSPIAPEPFSSKLKVLSPQDAAQAVGQALLKVWTALGW